METPTSNIFFDISNPSEQVGRIEKHELTLGTALFKELGMLIVVLGVFFLPVPKTLLPLAIIPVVVMVALFPGLGLIAVSLGLIIDAGVLVLGQEARQTEHARAGHRSFYGDVSTALRRINRHQPQPSTHLSRVVRGTPRSSPQPWARAATE